MTKAEVLSRLASAPELHFIYNSFSYVPYIRCDDKTMYDYAEVFFDRDLADAEINDLNIIKE